MRHEYSRNVPVEAVNSQENKNLPSEAVSNPEGDPYFIGIAISGGGSRAAALGAGALMQLNDLGILGETTMISSVSGGSLPAAYFVLAKSGKAGVGGCDGQKTMTGNCDQLLSEPHLRETFGQNFEIPLLERDTFYSIVKFGSFNTWNRTDAEGELFGERLFTDEQGHEATFADLPPKPQLVLNASDEVRGGKPFTFTHETFEGLCSNLSTVKIGAAVATSAAFPFLLRSVAYHNYGPPKDGVNCETPSKIEKQRYTNLFDGGVTDNLGVYALEDAYTTWANVNAQSSKCLIIVVDSYVPLPDVKARAYSDDLRSPWDAVFDFTGLDMSTSILLARRRESDLRAIGFTTVQSDDPDDPPTKPEDSFLVGSRPDKNDLFYSCDVWHLNLASWPENYEKEFDSRPEQYRPATNHAMVSDLACNFQLPRAKSDTYNRFKDSVETVPTSFCLTKQQVNDLFLAAYLKVNLPYNKNCLCAMFKDKTGKDCINYGPNPQRCFNTDGKPGSSVGMVPAD
jgi:predicted acylesterase/phospholipase RssA